MNLLQLGAAIGNAPKGGSSEPEYLTFTNVHPTETAHISMNTNPEETGTPNEPVIYWSKTKDNFIKWDYSPIELLPGEKVYMYGDNPDGVNKVNEESGLLRACFVINDAAVAASGNIQTLRTVEAERKSPIEETECDYTALFYECTSLVAGPELPATTLATNCYASMFAGCTGLTAAPKLSATTLADGCYEGMFSGCTGLTAAPELPTTTLATYCYASMFAGCTGLTAAPELSATTLADGCYEEMFAGCASIKTVHVHFIEWPETGFGMWLNGVSPTGTFYKPAALPEQRGEDYIPEGWTIVNE